MADDRIVATSPTIPPDETTLAHRMVIRDLGDKYVVHMQIFEGEKHYFHRGNYFPKTRRERSGEIVGVLRH